MTCRHGESVQLGSQEETSTEGSVREIGIIIINILVYLILLFFYNKFVKSKKFFSHVTKGIRGRSLIKIFNTAIFSIVILSFPSFLWDVGDCIAILYGSVCKRLSGSTHDLRCFCVFTINPVLLVFFFKQWMAVFQSGKSV